ncbi:MAG: DNA starvation/stationary phase protection protein [Acidimicrobiales bacterium]|nr:DNA starvation/stationary phase protection protein [Acidimicrobiales bacterium]
MSTSTTAEAPLRTVAGIGTEHAEATIEQLQHRLVSLIDLELTLKHVHWNVVGPNFISVHEMIDTFVAEVRPQVDALAERIRTLGGTPTGLSGDVVKLRSWDDYDIGEAESEVHLRALDRVYDGIVLDHRRAIAHVANTDPVTEGLLVDQTAELEMQQWFVRSFLKGRQPDADRRFGSADRAPTASEAAEAEAAGTPSEDVAEHYRDMAKTGASVRGEGQVDGSG